MKTKFDILFNKVINECKSTNKVVKESPDDLQEFVKPEVGMDVTDRYYDEAYRVVDVDRDGKGCTLQKYDKILTDKALANGDYYSMDYEYEDENGNPNLSKQVMHIRYKNGTWKSRTRDLDLAFGERPAVRFRQH
jgi:hypothetical protein